MRPAALRWKCIFTIFSTPWHIRLLTAKNLRTIYSQIYDWLTNVMFNKRQHFIFTQSGAIQLSVEQYPKTTRGDIALHCNVIKQKATHYCSYIYTIIYYIHLLYPLFISYHCAYKLNPRTFFNFHAYIKIEIERTVFINLIFSSLYTYI